MEWQVFNVFDPALPNNLPVMVLSAISRTLVSVLAIALGAKFLLWRQKLKKLPPGPSKLPFVDNLFNMPAGLNPIVFRDLGKKHESDIIHLSALGTSIVVLNSYQAARDLLEQRSGIYSSRNVATMSHELTPIHTLFVVAPYDDTWRACRRIFTKYFAAENTVINRPRDVFYTRRFLTQLLANPANFRHQMSSLLSATSVSMTYGIKPIADHDPYAKLAERAAGTTSKLLAKSPYLVDLIPTLKHLPEWFPGTSFLLIAKECTHHLNASREGLFDAGISAMNSQGQDYCPSFLSEALRDLEGQSEADVETQKGLIKDVANMVYLAAFDTTLSSLATFFLAMTCYPEVQAKAQRELDAVLKRRLPEHNDVESLPYLTAITMEVLRWIPALPIGKSQPGRGRKIYSSSPGTPHVSTLDDVYRGYHIPKGSIVIANQWGMLNDPENYPNPSEFNPERFLKDGQIDESVVSSMNIAFGFGRRTCPGRHIAVSTLKLAMASVLSTFEINKKVDSNGKVMEPSREYSLEIVSQPKEFPCTIRPRSESAIRTINSWALLEGDNPP